MRQRLVRWLSRWCFPLLFLAALCSFEAWARGGGGQHYTAPSRSSGGGSSSGGSDDGFIFSLIFSLFIRYPQVMCPLLLVGGLVWYWNNRTNNPTRRTQQAFQEREGELRTQVSAQDVQGWVNALQLKDAHFDLAALIEKAKTLFFEVQKAWFLRDLKPVHPFLSDATFQRFNVQLALMSAQGVRNAITDIKILDAQLIGLDQSNWFDVVHLRIRAQMRDTDVPVQTSDVEAIAAAERAPLEPFTEVWTFVRKPGAKTKIGEDLFQGKCPNCGAPFAGGAANNCTHCGAVVNSGNYDWTLSEITQGVEYVRGYQTVDGLLQARQADPALNLEVLEDRASLIFWKWIDAESRGEAKRLGKVALVEYTAKVDQELTALQQRGRRKVFLECAVGGVNTKVFRQDQGFDQAHVEIRWSARMGIGPVNEAPPELPTVPQRWIFVLVRKAGATTRVDNGMSTNRCPNCNAPLTEGASDTCEYCGTLLSDGGRDWVLASASSHDAWNSDETFRYQDAQQRESTARGADAVVDVHERERLLYMMAALAAADGVVDDRERKLLKVCSERWSIPWEKVEVAIRAGPTLFERLVPQASSPEAEVFLRSLVNMALIDGRVDRKERKMLDLAAEKLGLTDKLAELLTGH